MGYTNYWNIKPSFLKQNPLKFDPQMLAIMKRVVKFYNEKQTDKNMQLKSRLTAKRIQLYGDPATYETFDITFVKDPRLGRIGIDSFTFCKTAREPYDRVVKVFLNLLKYFKVITSWSHDDNGRCTEYRKAVAFAKQVYTAEEFNRYWKQKA